MADLADTGLRAKRETQLERIKRALADVPAGEELLGGVGEGRDRRLSRSAPRQREGQVALTGRRLPALCQAERVYRAGRIHRGAQRRRHDPGLRRAVGAGARPPRSGSGDVTRKQRLQLATLLAEISRFQDGLATLSGCCDAILDALMEIQRTGTVSPETAADKLPMLDALNKFDPAGGCEALGRCSVFLAEVLGVEI